MKINEELRKMYPWKERWDFRAKIAVSKIPKGSSIIDLGGGLGEVYKAMGGECRYVSIDLRSWNDLTVVGDFNKGEFPEIYGKADFVVCLGILEYIEDPMYFLNEIKKYSDKLILSYREKSCGGMDRKNNLSYIELGEFLKFSGWKLEASKKVRKSEMIYFLTRAYL